MNIKWTAFTVLSLALAAQALTRTEGGRAERMQEGVPVNEAGSLNPGTTNYDIERSTRTTWVDRSTGAPAGMEDPRRRGMGAGESTTPAP